MKIFLILLSITCYCAPTYKITPEGKFLLKPMFRKKDQEVHEMITSRVFTRFVITDEYKELGCVEKSDSFLRGYTLALDDSFSSIESRPFSYGALFDSIKEFNVYDVNGDFLGYITGCRLTTSPGEFWFSDTRGTYFAKALINKEHNRLEISTIDNQPLYACEKTFRFAHTLSDYPHYYWTVKQLGDGIDERFLWPFMAFVSEVWWQGQTSSKPT